jgi:peptidoglycan/xylan/chitin deacetylase (PgdA/CDA1 family)
MSFDDVPESAVEYGVPILDRYGVKATFYVSLALATQGRFLDAGGISSLHNSGHEIGCHTFSHYRLSEGTIHGMLKDAELSRSTLAVALDGVRPASFSFPFGEMSLRLKKGLQRQYETLRSSRPGVNSGTIDLSCLRGNSLRSDQFSTDRIAGWLDSAEKVKGWLIFYTHGICGDPGTFDLSTDMFEELLTLCKARGFQFERIVDVARSITGSFIDERSQSQH